MGNSAKAWKDLKQNMKKKEGKFLEYYQNFTLDYKIVSLLQFIFFQYQNINFNCTGKYQTHNQAKFDDMATPNLMTVDCLPITYDEHQPTATNRSVTEPLNNFCFLAKPRIKLQFFFTFFVFNC